MPCLHSGNLTICIPTVAQWSIRRRYCRYCKAKTLWFGTFEDWYGWTIHCLGCGGEPYERRSKIASRRSERVARIIARIDSMNTPANEYHGEIR